MGLFDAIDLISFCKVDGGNTENKTLPSKKPRMAWRKSPPCQTHPIAPSIMSIGQTKLQSGSGLELAWQSADGSVKESLRRKGKGRNDVDYDIRWPWIKGRKEANDSEYKGFTICLFGMDVQVVGNIFNATLNLASVWTYYIVLGAGAGRPAGWARNRTLK